MVDCASYCMFISAPGSIFLFYLGLLIAIGSETIYSVPKHRFQSSVMLFLTSFVYAAIFAFCYYSKYYTLQARRENLEQWVNNFDVRQVEMQTVQQPTERQQEKRQVGDALYDD